VTELSRNGIIVRKLINPCTGVFLTDGRGVLVVKFSCVNGFNVKVVVEC